MCVKIHRGAKSLKYIDTDARIYSQFMFNKPFSSSTQRLSFLLHTFTSESSGDVRAVTACTEDAMLNTLSCPLAAQMH